MTFDYDGRDILHRALIESVDAAADRILALAAAECILAKNSCAIIAYSRRTAAKS
jgi:hypothetical protein